jgi:hypothetical protein
MTLSAPYAAQIRLRLLPLFCFLSLLLVNAVYGKSMPVEQRDAARQELNQMAEEIIEDVIKQNPGVQEHLDNSVGYMTGEAFAAKSLLLGGGSGVGLIYDNSTGSRTYIDFKRIEFGVGVGAATYRYLVIFRDQESLLKFRRGTWRSSSSAEAVIGEPDELSSESTEKGFRTYVLSDTGANASITIRLLRVTVDYDLTDAGVANTSMAMRGFEDGGRQGKDAPRVWDHRLPFGAQKALDKGFDLPLPFGVSMVYAHIEQDQLLKSLEGGLNGGEVVPLDFVAFENAESETDSLQLRFDAWLFPFMNVYAMAGNTDGKAPLDVLLDGNGLLDYLDISCDNIINNPLCKVLDGETILLPTEAKPSGSIYSLGAIFAGGWGGYFVTVPVNWTIGDLDGRETEGEIFTITPRVGKVFNMNEYGNLAIFAGANYLDTKLTVSGEYVFPGEGLTVEYVVRQENKDKWNGVLGGNWEINRHWSIVVEYDGFFGSREALLGSLTWRF